MKIAVCVKIVNGEPNPFDASALECALRLGGEITLLCMCPKSAEMPLKRLTRLNVKAVLLSDPSFAGSDTLATAYILSHAIRKINPDLILCGRQTIDGDTAQVGPSLATMLQIPVITNAMEITKTDEIIHCVTRMGNEESILPCLITVERICELRFPSIRAKTGEVEIWNNDILKADTQKCGIKGSPTRVLKTFENTRGKRRCQFITMDELRPLVEKLENEQRKEIVYKESDVKLKELWTIGVLEVAGTIAENVVVIEETDPVIIAKMAKEKKPEVILWNADLWGRKNAPITASLLETGLCADCTALETDGNRLYMYRPAKSGSITAKIECRTNPQMATVRTVSDSSDIIVSGGKGVKDCYDKFKEFAASYNAEIGASRGLVDMGIAPYNQQIGLTGKAVSPKIYIAIGISGAVHHTCAIENAGTVIAINPDKNAPIFDYADYGIIDKL